MSDAISKPSLWTAVCSTCQKELSLEEFYQIKSGKYRGKYNKECKKCGNERSRRAREKLSKHRPPRGRTLVQATGETLICQACQQEQPLENFYQDKSGIYAGFYRINKCKKCNSEHQRHQTHSFLEQKRQQAPRQKKSPTQEVYEVLKVCKACGQEKPIEAFPLLRGKNEGYLQREPRCKECAKTRARESARIKQLQKERERIEKSLALEWEARIKEKEHKQYNSHLQRCFGKTFEEYNAMVRDQQGKCAICGEIVELIGERLVVDHSHVTGTIRGLLCPSCNFGLGWFRDSSESLQKAIEYLHLYHPWEEDTAS